MGQEAETQRVARGAYTWEVSSPSLVPQSLDHGPGEMHPIPRACMMPCSSRQHGRVLEGLLLLLIGFVGGLRILWCVDLASFHLQRSCLVVWRWCYMVQKALSQSKGSGARRPDGSQSMSVF